jgi:hypothetical protein
MRKLLIDLVRKGSVADLRIDGKVDPTVRDELRHSYSIAGSVTGEVRSVV